MRTLALRGAEALERGRHESEKALELLLNVADGTSGLDLERLRTARERAWG